MDKTTRSEPVAPAVGIPVERWVRPPEIVAREAAAERERWNKAAAAALEILDDLPSWSNAGHACKLLRDGLGHNAESSRDTIAWVRFCAGSGGW